MRTRRGAVAALAGVLTMTTAATADTRSTGEPLVALWADVDTTALTPAGIKTLSRSTSRTVRAVFVPRSAVSPVDLGARSLYADLDRAGLLGPITPQLADGLRHVPAGTTMTMTSAASFGLPNGHLDSMDQGDDDCVSAPACATISIAITLSGVSPECSLPTVFGLCIYAAPPAPQFNFHTEQTADVVRVDTAVDTLYPSRPHFRSTSGGDWGHRFSVTTTNPNQPGAGAHYFATSHGEWAPVAPGSLPVPVGLTIETSTTLISGFCLRWAARYPTGESGARQDNFQLRGDVTLGAFTGHQWIHNEGMCTL